MFTLHSITTRTGYALLNSGIVNAEYSHIQNESGSINSDCECVTHALHILAQFSCWVRKSVHSIDSLNAKLNCNLLYIVCECVVSKQISIQVISMWTNWLYAVGVYQVHSTAHTHTQTQRVRITPAFTSRSDCVAVVWTSGSLDVKCKSKLVRCIVFTIAATFSWFRSA